MNTNSKIKEDAPDWIQLSPEEIEDKVLELRRKGFAPSQIGMVLRDKWGVPSTKEVLGKKITEILEEHDMKPAIPEDLQSLLDKARKVRKHLEQHPNDTENRRNFQLLQSKIKRLAKYYKKVDKLEEDWSSYQYIYR